MALIEVERCVRIYAQDLGSGPPVVLIAGFGMSHPVWDAEVRELVAAGHRVVCVDLRGTGGSDKPTHGYELDRLAQDVATAMVALEVHDASVLGWSFGGQVAFHLAATRPELVGRLVLLSSTAVRASRSDGFPFGAPPAKLLAALQKGERNGRIAARRTTISSGFARQPPDEDAVAFLMRVQLEMPSWAALACYETYLLSDLIGELPRVTQPVLQILGDSDPVTPLAAAEWLRDRLPDSRIAVLAGCGHYPMLEAGRELRAALLPFVDGS